MKRTPLLILGFLFLVLCIICFFHKGHSGFMLVALIVQLVFFIQFAMTKKERTIVAAQNNDFGEKPLSESKKIKREPLAAKAKNEIIGIGNV